MAELSVPRPRLLFGLAGSSPPSRPTSAHDPAPHRREESLAEAPKGILSRDSSAAALLSASRESRQDPSGATPPTPVGVGGDGRNRSRPRLLFEALGRLRLQDPPRPHDPAPHRREESLERMPLGGFSARDSSAAATAPVVKSEAGSIGSNASYTRRCRRRWRSRSKASTVVRGLGSSPPSRPASATRSGAPPPRGVSG